MKWKRLGVFASIPPYGRLRIRIRCLGCGMIKLVYLWSLAGHGKTECLGCGEWLRYNDEEK